MSFIASGRSRGATIIARWGDYRLEDSAEQEGASAGLWKRVPRNEEISFSFQENTPLQEIAVPNSRGLVLVISVRPLSNACSLPPDSRAVSLFLLNRRKPSALERKDEAFIFQAEIEYHSDTPLLPKPELRSFEKAEWDELVADLQYRDIHEYAVGHGVATEAKEIDLTCKSVKTCWIPSAEVERIAPADIPSVELEMEALEKLGDVAEARARLLGFFEQYMTWIGAQQTLVPQNPSTRKDAGDEMLKRAENAAQRIKKGIEAFDDPNVLEAFRLAN
jgi:hypothetical protein